MQSPEIKKEIKALVRAGDIDGAEALVDVHYEDKGKQEDLNIAAQRYERGAIKGSVANISKI